MQRVLPILSKKPTILILSILLILLSFALGYSLSNDKSITPHKEIAIPTTKEITVTLKPTLTKTPKPKQWVIEKNTNGLVETVASFCEGWGENIKQWQDWIFYDYDNYGSFGNALKIQVIGYNLSTGTSKVIYDLKDYKNDFPRGWPELVYEIKIINNTLFFSLSGYLGVGKTYWVNLPPKDNPKPLTQHGDIEYWKNQYWMINGYGDACWDRIEYSLLDVEQKKSTFIATSQTGCGGGEEFVGINKQDRMILAGHNWEDSDNSSIYTYVLGVPLSNSSVKEGLISKQDMPPSIKSIFYLEDNNQLLLINNKDKFIYDFNSKEISKTDTNIPTPTPTPTKFNREEFINSQIKELILPKNYTLRLTECTI